MTKSGLTTHAQLTLQTSSFVDYFAVLRNEIVLNKLKKTYVNSRICGLYRSNTASHV